MTGNYWNPSHTGPPPVCGNGAVEASEGCDDGNLASGDGCDANCTPTGCGNAIVTAGETCDDGNTTGGDCCNATCQLDVPGTPCDDGDPCSRADACAAGVCAGVLAPRAGCAGAAGGRLVLKDPTPGGRRLSWRWAPGTAAPGDFGNPVSGGTRYALCAYDAVAGTPVLRVRATAPSGSAWRPTATGFSYRDTSGAPGRMRQLRLKAGVGNASIRLDLKAGNLPPLGLPLAQSPVVTVQLSTSAGACWQAGYAAPAPANNATRFVDDAN